LQSERFLLKWQPLGCAAASSQEAGAESATGLATGSKRRPLRSSHDGDAGNADTKDKEESLNSSAELTVIERQVDA